MKELQALSGLPHSSPASDSGSDPPAEEDEALGGREAAAAEATHDADQLPGTNCGGGEGEGRPRLFFFFFFKVLAVCFPKREACDVAS